MSKEKELEERLNFLNSHKEETEILLEIVNKEINRVQDELDNLRIQRDAIEGDSDFENE